MIDRTTPALDERGATAVEYSVVTVAAASLAGMFMLTFPSPIGVNLGKLMRWVIEQFMPGFGG